MIWSHDQTTSDQVYLHFSHLNPVESDEVSIEDLGHIGLSQQQGLVP